MYEILKLISENKDWIFQYGRRDFANLYDEMPNGKVHIFLDPVRIENEFDEFDVLDTMNYTGTLMLVVSSEFDQDYLTKYVENIKPLIDGAGKELLDSLACHPDYSINQWSSLEVINILDYGFDGLLITYNVAEDVQ